jgi:tetratricopeptide (TPR) repeat protein
MVDEGISQVSNEDYAKAIEHFDGLLLINKNCYYCHYYKAFSEFKLKDYTRSVADYTKAINQLEADGWRRVLTKDSIDRERSNYYSQRGDAKVKLSDFRGAILDYSKSIELNPKNTHSFAGRGFAKGGMNKFQEAVLDFQRAILLDENDPLAYVGRALANISLNNLDSACLDLSKAGELGDSSAYDLIVAYCN